MAKCSEIGCNNEAVKGAGLCIYHRDKKNETKDSWIKTGLSLVGMLFVGVAGFFVASGRKDA